MTDETLIEYSVDEGLAIFELNAPPANTYTYEMMRQLDDAILIARSDPDVHLLLLRGKGEKFFSAGADINMLSQADPGFKYCFCLHANETLNRLEHTPKLTIAALNGHTVGGGLEIALACDLRIAKKNGGKIGFPEVKLGVLPGTGGTQRLTRLVGKARAIELMISGRTFSPEEAVTLGLVHQVYDEDGFFESVKEYARQFVPPHAASKAVGHIKRAVLSGSESGFLEGLSLERELQQLLFQSQDAREGIQAYVEKRQPQFQGK